MRNLSKSINQMSHSSDKITILGDCTGKYIVKTFNCIEHGKLAVLKQKLFEPIISNKWRLSAPIIYQEELSDGCLKVTMEYVDGYSGYELEYLNSISSYEILKNAFGILVTRNFELATEKEVPSSVFNEKLKRIKEFNYTTKNKSRDMNLDFLEELINSASSWSMPVGKCHGDLTLSNIIASSSTHFSVIDFLPTFLESPLWDVVKLYQDLNYGWSSRYLTGAQKMNIIIMSRAVMPQSVERLKHYYSKSYKLLMTLCLARIYPYTKDLVTLEWINTSIQKLRDE